MSVDSVSHLENQPTSAVAYLDSARVQRAESPAGQIEEMQTKLATERNAGKAMLVTVLELERRLDTERSTGQALLASVRDLGKSLEEQRKLVRKQRLDHEQLWADINGLDIALREAERPLWRKLLGRR